MRCWTLPACNCCRSGLCTAESQVPLLQPVCSSLYCSAQCFVLSVLIEACISSRGVSKRTYFKKRLHSKPMCTYRHVHAQARGELGSLGSGVAGACGMSVM